MIIIEANSLAEINDPTDKINENEIMDILINQNEQIKSLKEENMFINSQISIMKIQLENRLDQIQDDYTQLKIKYDDIHQER
jgi:hypothetical protein